MDLQPGRPGGRADRGGAQGGPAAAGARRPSEAARPAGGSPLPPPVDWREAGPREIAESLASDLPLVITGLLPVQETPNVDFVVASRIGAFAPKESDLLDEVRVIAEGGPTWREMSRNAEELAHPYASSDIARECLLLAARYRASAQASR